MCNQTVEHDMAVFLCCIYMLAGNATRRLVRTTSNSANLSNVKLLNYSSDGGQSC